MLRSILIKSMLLAILAIISQSGCSAVGYGTGCVLDSRRPAGFDITAEKISDNKIGKKVDISLKSGETIQGRYLGIERMSAEQYAQEYNEHCDEIAESHYLPHFGDTIDVTLTSGMRLRRRFIGFDYDFGNVRMSGETGVPSYIAIGLVNDSRRGRIYTCEISRITGLSGAFIEKETIDELLLGNNIPLYSSLIIGVGKDERSLKMDQIEGIRTRNGRHYKYYGLALGLAVDAALIFLGPPIGGPFGGGPF